MFIPKKYGKSKVEKCPFCDQQAITFNKQGLIVCRNHISALLGEMKCVCGKFADLKTGKWGVYFSCLSCGNVNAKKIFEINNVINLNGKNENKSPENIIQKRKNPTEITIRSDDPRYFN
ncbi:hypothetical protein J4410_02290 [Candidatus Woesearchaeota archaeon]|nr:hypothetical protein [Candidatus Woesearchaeota archaeon]